MKDLAADGARPARLSEPGALRLAGTPRRRLLASAWIAGACLFAATTALTGASLTEVPVLNGTFEASHDSGAGPQDWTSTCSESDSAAALAGAWTAEQPFDGERAARLDARRGSTAWQSQPLKIAPAANYLLQWQTRFGGEKPWRFRAEFCGVQVDYFDEHGNQVGSDRQHTHCWQTAGWRPAWMLLKSPASAAALSIRFALETSERLPGTFDVDAVKLSEWPLRLGADGRGMLVVDVRDETGQPTAARILVEDTQGRSFSPPAAVSYRLARGAFHPLTDDAVHLAVPPGTYRVVVTRGFDVWPVVSSVEVAAGHTTPCTVQLKQLDDWNSRGWFCGDHHVHLYRHGGSLFPCLTWRDIQRCGSAEGLDFLPFMGADRYPAGETAAETRGNLWRRTGGSAIDVGPLMDWTDEITDDLWGHVCPIGFPPEARIDDRYRHGPMNFDRAAAGIASGRGVLCYAHPYGPLEAQDGLDPVAALDRGHVSREMPIDLALGIPCGFDLLTMEGRGNQLDQKLRDLYRLYNLGFRPAVTAATDFHVDQGRQPLGAVRTYVHAASLDWPAVAAGYRAGRTFASNGPLVDLDINGSGPGETLQLRKSGDPLEIRFTACSIGRLERLEIVANGKVVHAAIPTADPHRISGAIRLHAEKSRWFAVRVFGPADEHLAAQLEGRLLGAEAFGGVQFAHTSPVDVCVEGAPVRDPQPGDAEYFARWCDAVLEAWHAHLLQSPQSGQHTRLVVERIRRAKDVFLERAATVGER